MWQEVTRVKIVVKKVEKILATSLTGPIAES